MNLYRGFESYLTKCAFLKHRISYCEKGIYGKAVYATSDETMALTYASGDKKCVAKFTVSDEYIKSLSSNQVSVICTGKRSLKRTFETASEHPNLYDYAKKNKIKAILIKYKNSDELVIYDKSIIQDIQNYI